MNQLFKKRKEQLGFFQGLLSKPKSVSIPREFNESAIMVCDSCGGASSKKDMASNLFVCPSCNYHSKLTPQQRLYQLIDENSFRETNRKMSSTSVALFPGYLDKYNKNVGSTGNLEAVVCGVASIGGNKTAIAILDAHFMMGSMGSVVGEKITRLIELADRKKLPLIIFSASGGARMQEGINSLMQMAKTSAALAHFGENGGFYLSVLTHPTTGGVSASFAMLGDIILAEPGALIGFAGRRVIEKTMNEKLPDNFQTAEFIREKGFVDRIVARKQLRNTLITLLEYHKEASI